MSGESIPNEDIELTKVEVGLIGKLLAAISIESFRKLLTKNVLDAFVASHENTNVEFNFNRSKPDPEAIAFLKEREIILSDKTSSKLEGDLKYQLLEGLKANESIDQITRRLDIIFTDMMPFQLERIARTECLHSMNAGRQSAYEKSDVVEYKMIIGATDKRLCALCRRMRGQVQPLNKPFKDKTTGESWMHPPFHPNGRCSTVPLMDLPDNPIIIEGETYDSDEKLGKVEINVNLLKSQDKIESLDKNEREVWVKQTAKRKGHWRKIKGTKPDVKRVEIDTKSIKTDGLSRIKAIIPNVNFDGATEAQLNSIAEAVEETIGKFPDVRVDSMGWATDTDDAMYGLPDAAYIPKQHIHPTSKIILRKSVADDTESWADKAKLNFTAGKEKGIKSCNNMIKFYTDGDLPEDVDIFKEKLEGINACSRTFVALAGDDRLKGIMIHECYHAISGAFGLEDTFAVQLEKNGVTKRDKMAVSDYGSSQDAELWAETGVAMELGIDIPDSIKRAFESTIEAI